MEGASRPAGCRPMARSAARHGLQRGSTCLDWQLDVCPQSLALPSYLRYAPSHVLPTTLATTPAVPFADNFQVPPVAPLSPDSALP